MLGLQDKGHAITELVVAFIRKILTPYSSKFLLIFLNTSKYTLGLLDKGHAIKELVEQEDHLRDLLLTARQTIYLLS